jgi:hypothetical protein
MRKMREREREREKTMRTGGREFERSKKKPGTD